MKEKYIQLLQDQIEQLNKKDFDLNAWKAHTNVILAKIFGDNNQKIRQINEIEYKYGSWSLRDASGSESAMDICKKLGKEILNAAIIELENFGIPEKSAAMGEDSVNETVINAFKDELTGSQVKEIKKILTTSEKDDIKEDHVLSIFNRLGSNTLSKILSRIVMNNDIYNNL
jgi:hypothetical protein